MSRLLLALALLLVACEPEPAPKPPTTPLDRRSAWPSLEQLVDNIQFIREPRSGLCFAVTWAGDFRGGPAMAGVNCDAVAGLLR